MARSSCNILTSFEPLTFTRIVPRLQLSFWKDLYVSNVGIATSRAAVVELASSDDFHCIPCEGNSYLCRHFPKCCLLQRLGFFALQLCRKMRQVCEHILANKELEPKGLKYSTSISYEQGMQMRFL